MNSYVVVAVEISQKGYPMIIKRQIFDAQTCKDLIDLNAHNYEPGRVGNRIDPFVRSNAVCWIEYDVHRLAEYFPMHDWIANPCQLSRYQPGEAYNWHHDVIKGRSSRRLYTLTVTLQCAENAHLQIDDAVIELGVGEGVIFDSDRQHRALAPTAGIRYAFTTWAMTRNR